MNYLVRKYLTDGALARCLGRAEATETLNKVHKDVCGQTLDVTLYRRL